MKDPRRVEAHRPFLHDEEVRAFLARQPDLHAIDLSDCALNDPQIDELCEADLPSLRTLRLENDLLTDLAVERLCRATFHLSELSLRGNRIEDAGWRVIASSERASELVALDLADSWFEVVSIATFAGSPYFRNLRSLDWSGLWEGAIEEDEAASLRAASWMRAIQRLGLDRAFINGATLMRLVETPLLEELSELSLRHCHFGWDDAQVLSRASVARTLVDLDLRDNDLGASYEDDCWNWLAHLKCLRRLRWGAPRDRPPGHLSDQQWKSLLNEVAPRLQGFAACNTGLEPRLVAQLVGLEWPHLDELDLSNNMVGDEGLRLLMRSSLARVHTLALANCQLGAASVATLAATSSGFVALDLANNPLAGSSVQLLTGTAVRRLERASLAGTGLTDGDLSALARSPYLGELHSLDISSNPITRIGLETLLQSNVLTSLERVRFSVPPALGDDELAHLHDASLARGIALWAQGPDDHD